MTGMRALSAEERNRIETAVAAAEARTCAEFAVVVAQASDDYAAFPLLWSALLALLVGGGIAIAAPGMSVGTTFAMQATVLVVAGLLLYLRPLRVRLAPTAVQQTHAMRLARLQFAALVHERTRGGMGLLLFVSLAERHVEILVDRGIAERIPETAWQNVIDDFVGEIRAGHVAQGFIAAVQGCTAVLEQHFPSASGDHNEIADRVTEI